MKQRPLRGFGAVAPAQLVELAASVRRVVDRMLRIDGAPEELVSARLSLDEVARQLEPHARPEGMPRLGKAGREDARPYYVDGVVLPSHHPEAPELQITTEDERTRGTVLFRVVFEGPPGHVHGGHVASFFDQVLGHHNLELGLPAMTASLTIRYRRPTPLFRPIDFEVRTRSIEGRKVVTEGVLRAGDDVFAEAEGLFILPVGDRAHPLSGITS